MSVAAEAKGLEAIADVAMLRLFLQEFQEANPQLIAARRASFLRTDIQTFHQASAAPASLDLRSQLSLVTLLVLVMVGEFDEATSPPMSRELAAGLPDAYLKILEGCAHVPQLQEPEQFHAAIADFLHDRL